MLHLGTEKIQVYNATSLTCKRPAGVQYKDIMFALVFTNGAYANSAPSGWTRHLYANPSPYFELYYKIATNAEPENYTWGWASAQTDNGITISAFRGGFNPSNPFNVSSNTIYGVNNSTIQAASMTTTVAGLYLLLFAGYYDGDYTSHVFSDPTVPATFTRDYSHSYREMRYYWPLIFQTLWSSSGATGTMSFTETNSRSTTWKHAFAVALNKPTTATISGNVKKGGANLAGATVRLFHKDMGCLASKTTDANGNYSFSGDYGTGDYVIAGETYHVVIEYTDGSSNKFNAKSLWGITPTT